MLKKIIEFIKNKIEILKAALREIKKNKRKKRIFISILLLIIIIMFLYLTKSLFIAATVNGIPISRLSLIKQLEKQGGSQVLESLISKSLLTQEAKNKQIEVTQQEIDAEVKKIESGLKEQNMDLDTALSLQGYKRDDFLEELRLRLVIEKLLKDRITVTEEELKVYFDENKSNYSESNFADVKSQIEDTLFQQKLSQEYKKWLQETTTKARIKYFISF